MHVNALIAWDDMIDDMYDIDGTFNLRCADCNSDEYNLELSHYMLRSPDNGISPSVNEVNTGQCFKCPSGGICQQGKIVAVPNQWGFIHGREMSFDICPSQYCCQASPCESYDTCKLGRSGRMCGECSVGYQLSVLNDDCIQAKLCQESWLSAVIVISGLIYIGFLIVKVEVKNVMRLLPDIYAKCCKKCTKDTDVYVKEGEMGEKSAVENFENFEKFEKSPKPGVSTPFDYVEIFHIFVYYLQDTGLFNTDIPDKPVPDTSIVDEYQEKFIHLARLDSTGVFDLKTACYEAETSGTRKMFVKTSIVPFMVIVFLAFTLIMKISRVSRGVWERIMSTVVRAFLLTVLFSQQQLTTTAFSFVKCVWLGSGHYMWIDATQQCYQPWQIIVFFYILLFTMMFWVSMLLGPGLLGHGLISVWTFLLGILFPAPFVVYAIWLIDKNRKESVKASCPTRTTYGVLDEVWYSFRAFKSSEYISWGGIVELRRLGLVVSATLIATPIARITCMTLIVLIAIIVHLEYRPYADWTANMMSNVSLFATLMVGMINFGWATIVYTQADFQSGDADTIGQAMVTLEGAFIQGVPAFIIVFCLVQFLVVYFTQRFTPKVTTSGTMPAGQAYAHGQAYANEMAYNHDGILEMEKNGTHKVIMNVPYGTDM